jgi:hypothetical protein
MQSAFIATCPNSNEAAIVVLGVTTVSEFRAAAAAQGLIRTCDDEEGYEFYKPLQAWAVLTPEGTWDLGASSDTPDALPAMVATARWVSITSCQCEACPMKDGTHKPAGALLQIGEPKSSVNQVDEAINSLLRAALIEGGCSAERVIEAREETNLRRAELRTLLSTPQPCSRSHPHEEMTPMCELRTEIARLTNALARAEAQLAAPHPLHQHLLHMLGAKDHEDAGCIIARLHALELAAAPQAVQAAVPAVRGEVLVTVSGFTGSGKSAIAGEIEIMCRALGLQVEWPDGVTEKNMTHADWTTALELYNPRVRIIERNVPCNTASGADQ